MRCNVFLWCYYFLRASFLKTAFRGEIAFLVFFLKIANLFLNISQMFYYFWGGFIWLLIREVLFLVCV